MRISKRAALELCAATTEASFKNRYDGICYDVNDAEETTSLVATNGVVHLRIPCKFDAGDTSGIIPTAAWVAAKKLALSEIQIRVADGVCTLTDGATYPCCPGPYPQTKQVESRAHRQGDVQVTLNPTLLLNLVKAMGWTSSVTLSISPDKKGEVSPIRVFHSRPPSSKDDKKKAGPVDYNAVGLLMPIAAPKAKEAAK